jgi:hypothetical protein
VFTLSTVVLWSTKELGSWLLKKASDITFGIRVQDLKDGALIEAH